MTTDEVLSAYIDGELPPEEMEVVRREIEASAALADRVEALKRADRLVADAYRGIDVEPMPRGVLDLLAAHEQQTNIVRFPSHRGNRGGGPPWAAALAASLALAVGVGVGLQLSGPPSGNGAMLVAGVIGKGDPVYRALETAPSAETIALGARGEATLTPVLTFRSTAGDYCREFEMTAGDRSNRAVACRQNDQWAIEFAVAAAPASADSASYSTASSNLDAAFDSFVGNLVANEPLGAEEEAAAIKSGWKADR